MSAAEDRVAKMSLKTFCGRNNFCGFDEKPTAELRIGRVDFRPQLIS
jgi:hypothetical protein